MTCFDNLNPTSGNVILFQFIRCNCGPKRKGELLLQVLPQKYTLTPG